jgi:hypothetical protein
VYFCISVLLAVRSGDWTDQKYRNTEKQRLGVYPFVFFWRSLPALILSQGVLVTDRQLWSTAFLVRNSIALHVVTVSPH